MLKTAFENLRSRCPLIHNITNYVTVNCTSRSRRKAVSVRRREAPAPTGSSTTG